MKRTIEFLDEKRNKVIAKVELKKGRFSMSGEYTGSFGQCFDDVVPANDEQKRLMDIWRKYHLSSVPEDFEDELTDLLDEIEQIEEDAADREVEESDLDLFQDFDRPELALALALMLDLKVNEIEDIEENDDIHWTVQGVDYLAGDDDEMDQEWEDDLDNYLEECVYPDLPENMRNYFDDDAWKRDAKFDGRGHSLNRYDGGELETCVNGTYYYAYRN